MIIIPGRIPSKKNSRSVFNGRLVTNKKYLERVKFAKIIAKNQYKGETITTPISIHYQFYFPDKRKTDISNKIESINDMFVECGILQDDNHEIVQQIIGTSRGICPKTPRVEIEFIEL